MLNAEHGWTDDGENNKHAWERVRDMEKQIKNVDVSISSVSLFNRPWYIYVCIS